MSDLLARIEAGVAAVLAGGEAPDLARDLASVAHSDSFEVTAEVDSPDDLVFAARLGAHAVRLDAELAMPRAPTRAALAVTGAARARRLAILRAEVAERASPLLATGLDAVVVLGGQAGRSHFPRSEQRAVEVAATVTTPERAAGTIAALTARAGRLGVRGARWLATDPDLFAAIAGGWIDAARDHGRTRMGFSIPAVAFPDELAPARRMLRRIAGDTGVALSIGACIETVRGVLAVAAIERHSDFVELDLDALAETALCQARGDRAALVPMLEQGLLPVDPFAELDPALAALLVAARRPGRGVAIRGQCVLGARTLARLYELAIGGVCVPARDVATARVAHARRGVLPSSAARAAELERHASSAPRTIPDGPPPPLPNEKPRDVLDGLVAAVERGELTSCDAVRRIAPVVVDALARSVLDDQGREPRTIALGVAPGAGVGRVALTPAKVLELRRTGEPAILVVREVYGDEAAVVPETAGLVSTRGGRTSHAALVAANCGVPCVIDEHVQLGGESVTIGGHTLAEGDWLSIDGTSGAVFTERLPLAPGAPPQLLATITRWADEARHLRVLANADTPAAIAAAIASGAQGIGLVRTENMFLDPAQLEVLRVALLGERDTTQLEAMQREGFAARLAAARGAPVTFRLLDASFYELLPHDRPGLERLAHVLGMPVSAVAARVDAERPADPALSLRMSRLALLRPEIERAQLDALAHAWLATPGAAPLRIMVPMIISGAEAAAAAKRIRARIASVSPAIPVVIGAMIETPRAALDAADIARAVDFFAYGSNDLTQFTLGIARSTFGYVRLEIDPSESIDLDGVGALIHITEQLARAAKPTIVTGVCGNLGADPRSIRAFHALGLDYISVPPPQLTRARIAAASAIHRTER